MKLLLAFLRRDFLISVSYRFAAVMSVLGIAFVLVVLSYISRLVDTSQIPAMESYSGSYFAFVVLGMVQTQYFHVAARTFSVSVRTAQMTGVLEAVLCTGTSPTLVMVLSSAYPFLLATLRVIAMLTIAIVGFGLPVDQANVPAAFVVLIASLLAYLPFGLFSAAFIVRFKMGNPIPAFLGAVSALLAGVYFPVSVLPALLQTAAELLPITHGLEALRKTVLGGASMAEVAPELMALSIFFVVGSAIGVAVLRFSIDRARRSGSLGWY